jgi:adenylate cyclase
MAQEIERKYLVHLEKWAAVAKPQGEYYRQGYILTDKDKTIRVRLAGEKAFLTIKGLSKGMSRAEYEYAIPTQDAQELLEGFVVSELSKIRYKINYGEHLWEIDEFLGENEGLIVAEIELSHEAETFELPPWVAQEVTEESRYYNSNLTIFPYQKW